MSRASPSWIKLAPEREVRQILTVLWSHMSVVRAMLIVVSNNATAVRQSVLY